MQMQVKVLLGAALVLASGLGFVTGRVTSEPSGQDEVLRELHRQRELLEEHLSRQEAGPPLMRCATDSGAVDAAGLRAEVARTVREELKAAGVERAVPREEATPPPPSPRSVVAHQDGLRLIDEATRARRWREEDAATLRRLLIDMTPTQRQEVIRRLSTTINAGGLDVQVVGPPF
jgi:hypothetical protein